MVSVSGVGCGLRRAVSPFECLRRPSRARPLIDRLPGALAPRLIYDAAPRLRRSAEVARVSGVRCRGRIEDCLRRLSAKRAGTGDRGRGSVRTDAPKSHPPATAGGTDNAHAFAGDRDMRWAGRSKFEALMRSLPEAYLLRRGMRLKPSDRIDSHS
jgi:hypothetical protein